MARPALTTKWLAALLVVLSLVLWLGQVGATTAEPESAGLLLRPALENDAPIIATPEGDLRIVKIQFSDRWLPGCSPVGPVCRLPRNGYQLLGVWIERVGWKTDDPREAYDYAATLGKDAYVISEDGSRGERFAGSFQMAGLREPVSPELAIAFTVPVDARGFTLFWPDNPPIELTETWE